MGSTRAGSAGGGQASLGGEFLEFGDSLCCDLFSRLFKEKREKASERNGKKLREK
jgi:hypothetical protein